jgi:uncharacterized protein DUF1566
MTKSLVLMLALAAACTSGSGTSKGAGGGSDASGGSGASGGSAPGGAAGRLGVPGTGGSGNGGRSPIAAGGTSGGGGAPGGGRGGTTPSQSGGMGGGIAVGGRGDAGGSAGGGGDGGAWDPFVGVVRQPDADTTPVASCTGQPDLTLCRVVTSPDRWYDICVQGVCVSPGCGDTSCNVPAPHFPIPSNDLHTHLEVDHGPEPIVADLVTGLEWQGCSAGLSGDGCTEGTDRGMTWPDALVYCDGLTWGGNDDWYLPDQYELISILDWNEQNRDAIGNSLWVDKDAFPHADVWYWSTHVSRAGLILGIQYSVASNVIIDDTPDFADNHVRCVRRGSSRSSGYTGQRFMLSGTVIRDPATGLQWQSCLTGRIGPGCSGDGPSDPVPAGAFAYCDALSWAGFSDWRVPTYKEFHSIIQYPPLSESGDPALHAPFDTENGGPYRQIGTSWRPDATPLLGEKTGGNAIYPNASSTYPVMCVRGP